MKWWTRVALNYAKTESTRQQLSIARANQTLLRYYNCKLEKLNISIRDCFYQFNFDEGTNHFITTTKKRGFWVDSYLWILNFFLSGTDSLAWVGVGNMHVLSIEQIKIILQVHFGLPLYNKVQNLNESYCKKALNNLLDIGAGCGSVTTNFVPFFQNIYTTEVSYYMAQRLRQQNFICIETANLDYFINQNQFFDTIVCFNVLDRCEKPVSLLQQIKQLLQPVDTELGTPGGCLILSIVLPLKAYWENGTQKLQPQEQIKLSNLTFEEAVNSFVNNILEPNGFRVRFFSKVPYLSEGDSNADYYILPNAIFLLQPVQ
eukprot:TRINITY_DN8177_c0_g1_i1.p1 TRINITY_DN8177_c0_g1~~TRINITY_DN8177_c0_g1_i1.p1  ORF type:complete len:317 (+),score=136.80 TRINITY_DN8177_c0_g1_i1:79-1029(+)